MRLLAVRTALLLCCAPAASAQWPDGAGVVSAGWLAERLPNAGIVVLHVGHDDYAKGHIPGARALAYADVVVHPGSLRTELPDTAQLRARFEALGVGDSTLVVVYAHEGPMAMRVLFSLAYLGHERLAYLDGGLAGWRDAGFRVARGADRSARPTPGALRSAPRPELVASADWLLTRMAAPGLALLDTRTTGEYVGRGNRSGMPSAGHLDGARQLEWEDLFEDRSTRLRSRDALAALYRERVGDATEVVTYCWVGYRASATWYVARLLGYRVRMYDGSYQDWSQRGLPTKAGSEP